MHNIFNINYNALLSKKKQVAAYLGIYTNHPLSEEYRRKEWDGAFLRKCSARHVNYMCILSSTLGEFVTENVYADYYAPPDVKVCRLVFNASACGLPSSSSTKPKRIQLQSTMHYRAGRILVFQAT